MPDLVLDPFCLKGGEPESDFLDRFAFVEAEGGKKIFFEVKIRGDLRATPPGSTRAVPPFLYSGVHRSGCQRFEDRGLLTCKGSYRYRTV